MGENTKIWDYMGDIQWDNMGKYKIWEKWQMWEELKGGRMGGRMREVGGGRQYSNLFE